MTSLDIKYILEKIVRETNYEPSSETLVKLIDEGVLFLDKKAERSFIVGELVEDLPYELALTLYNKNCEGFQCLRSVLPATL